MIRRYIRKERILFYLFLVSGSIIIIRTCLLGVHPIFTIGYETGTILYDLSIGYLISYIFYFLVVYTKEESNKRNVSEYIAKRTNYIVCTGLMILKGMRINSQTRHCSFPPTRNEILSMLTKLDPTYAIVSIKNRERVKNDTYTWPEYFKNCIVRDSERFIGDLWLLLPYLETELIKILTDLKETLMFKAVHGAILPRDKTKINYQNESGAREIEEYLIVIYHLNEYIEKNYSQFVECSKQRIDDLCLALGKK